MTPLLFIKHKEESDGDDNVEKKNKSDKNN